MSILISIIAGYVLLVGVMVLFQQKLIFLPSTDLMVTPEEAGLQAEDITVQIDDGEQLHGWFFLNDEAEYVVILSHGNAGNISNRIDIAKLLTGVGVSVVLYDYRGYGQSSGKPGEEGFYSDIEAIVNFLKEKKGYPEQQMIMYGRSLGGAVASYAATQFDGCGLVLDSTFKNLKAMIGDLYPFVPSSLAKYKFPTEQYLQQISGIPVMIMHSPSDDLVDISHARYLYQIAEEPKQFVELRGGHNDSFNASSDIHSEHWRGFLEIVKDQKKRRNRKRRLIPLRRGSEQSEPGDDHLVFQGLKLDS